MPPPPRERRAAQAVRAPARAALSAAPHLGTVRLAFAVRFLAVAGFGVGNRDAWRRLEPEDPEKAEALLDTPLAELGEKDWQSYHSNVHCSTDELAKIASKVKPDLLILYHQLFNGVSDTALLRVTKR